MKQVIKKAAARPVDWVLYGVLNEQQRGKLTGAFSESQKEFIKRLINGKNQRKVNRLKQIKYHLYNLGFTERALRELENFYEQEKDPYIRRLASWELALWHANEYSEVGAEVALHYIQTAKEKEKDETKQRRIAIVEAECLDLIGEKQQAKAVIRQLLQREQHPDLYLAAANLEPDLKSRIPWINRALRLRGRAPVKLANEESAEYADLRTDVKKASIINGPKVSIILPAYNAEDGLAIALDSLLSQTWQNVELLVVDDQSPDNTKEVIESYVEKDERVNYLQTPVNSGPYVARNIALQAATGDFVTVNDADDWAHAEKIETQVQHLIDHPEIIANTSQLARMTEKDLKFYRRGTPGRYVFANMSSIMFRRQPVLEKLGAWDSVRFAADGEFKRRLLQAFGKEKFVDLETGPLAFPRQALQGLTSSSAFGYNGFFMGVRKEYVESFSLYHAQTSNLVYNFPQQTRPFPVPEPMWPKREEKTNGKRQFDVIIATDFRYKHALSYKEMIKQKAAGNRIGLVQLNHYHVEAPKEIDRSVRDQIDGEQVQLLVYGEKIATKKVIVFGMQLLAAYQKYIPEVDAQEKVVVIDQAPQLADRPEQAQKQMERYFGKGATWIAKDAAIRQLFLQYHPDAIQELSDDIWENDNYDSK